MRVFTVERVVNGVKRPITVRAINGPTAARLVDEAIGNGTVK